MSVTSHAASQAQSLPPKWGHASASVQNAIANASKKTGINFGYLMEKASAESSFNPDAKARTSSATGLYQFIDQTWLTMVSRHGAKYGLDDTKAGQLDLTPDTAGEKAAVLELRKDPKIAALMAAELARENRDYIVAHTGRTAETVTQTDLYMAHFLGANGASKFINAMDKTPASTGAALFPAAAKANRGVFFDRKSGEPLTVAAIYQRFDQKFEDGDSVQLNLAVALQDADATTDIKQDTAEAHRTAALAYVLGPRFQDIGPSAWGATSDIQRLTGSTKSWQRDHLMERIWDLSVDSATRKNHIDSLVMAQLWSQGS